jgi:hypothetical protein
LDDNKQTKIELDSKLNAIKELEQSLKQLQQNVLQYDEQIKQLKDENFKLKQQIELNEANYMQEQQQVDQQLSSNDSSSNVNLKYSKSLKVISENRIMSFQAPTIANSNTLGSVVNANVVAQQQTASIAPVLPNQITNTHRFEVSYFFSCGAEEGWFSATTGFLSAKRL